MPTSVDPTISNDANQYRNDGKNKQYVDQGTSVVTEKTDGPGDDEHHGDDVQ